MGEKRGSAFEEEIRFRNQGYRFWKTIRSAKSEVAVEPERDK
jgi:hypothetical protein